MDTQHKSPANDAGIALVTGGSRGLGRDMALNLAKKGLDVVLTFHQGREAAESVVAEITSLGRKAIALQLDVSKQAGYEDFFANRLKPQLMQTFGTAKFDFLINNAGVGLLAPVDEETAVDRIDHLINIHFKAGYFFTRQALAYLNDGGGIIHITSGLTRIIHPGYAAYASMKSALETLTKYQAKELAARRIRVNSVAPGAIATDFNGGAVRDNKEINDRIASVTALGRTGLPTDIGPVVAFLCTSDAYWINAQRIEASGGQQI